MAYGYRGFSNGMATGFSLLDTYYARKAGRERADRLDTENTRRFNIQNERQEMAAGLGNDLKREQLQAYKDESSANIWDSTMTGADGKPVDFTRLNPDQLKTKKGQMMQVFNNTPELKAQLANNPDVDPDNPMADMSFIYDQKTKQPSAVFKLRMRDGSVKPLTENRSGDPNDDVMIMPLSELDGQVRSLLGSKGALGERKATAATMATENRKFGRDKELAQIKVGANVTLEDSKQKNRIALQKLKNTSGGKITAAQQSNNSEIDEARRVITGLSRGEILRRTQEATSTGRDNPDFDPYLASLVRKAASRKVGDDPDFETISQGIYGGDTQPESTKIMTPLGGGAKEMDTDAFALSSDNTSAGDPARDLVEQERTAPLPGARQAPDGHWYVQKDGRWFRVVGQ